MKPEVKYVGNLRDQLEAVPLRHPSHPNLKTHRCGACKRMVTSARWLNGGLLVHIERAQRGDLEIVPELFAGAGLPHVAKSARRTQLQEHRCPTVMGFVSRAPQRKVRP